MLFHLKELSMQEVNTSLLFAIYYKLPSPLEGKLCRIKLKIIIYCFLSAIF